MSTRAYSQDLRERVIRYMEKGGSVAEAKALFGISSYPIHCWLKRKKEEGHIRARKPGGSKANMDSQKLKKYIEEHPETKLEELGKAFKMTGPGVRYWLKKLGYTYKKKSYTYVEACEQKRAIYKEKIKDIEPEKLVFIDESGIDRNIYRQKAWGKKGEIIHAKRSGKYYL